MKATPFRRAVIPKEDLQKIEILSLIFFVLEAAVCFMILMWQIDVRYYFILHAILVIALLCVLPTRKIEGATYTPFFAITFLFLGPFGALIGLLFCLYYPYRIKKGKTFMEWYEGLFPTEYFEEKFPTYERMLAEQEDYSSKAHLVPFIDIMHSGTEEEKAEAINKILLYFRPSFMPALVLGLNDKNPIIRVRAATAVARLEQEALLRREQLEEVIKRNPQDEEAILALARSEEGYSQTAFVSDAEREEMLHKSISLYKKYLELNPTVANERVRYAWLLFLAKDFEESRKEISKAVAETGIDGINTLRVYLKILFQQGDYQKIRELAAVDYPFLQEQREEEIRLRDILLLWRLSAFDDEVLNAS